MKPRPEDRPAPEKDDRRDPPVIDSRELMGDHQRVLIAHEGRVYELRRTRFGKLILTR